MLRMALRLFVASVAFVTFVTFGACSLMGAAHAQQKSHPHGGYPARPIRVLVTISPGGGPDVVVRMVSQIVNEKLGQPFVVDNRPGGGTVLATDLVANAAPDGYTLLNGTDTLMLVGAMKRVPYDIRTAFVPVVQMTSQWYVLVVNPSLPVKSVADLIAHAKSRPDALSYASQGVGTTGHLSMEHVKSLTGASMVHVPYKGAAPVLVDIISGQVQLMFSSLISGLPHVTSGKVRAVAVSSPRRVTQLPDTPTVAESGVPGLAGFKASNSYGLYAPAGTPPVIVRALSDAISAGLNTPAMQKRLAANGTEAVPPQTPEAFKAIIAQEYLLVEKQVRGLSLKDL
jgi:tripartite-type tricarboxylate transporter receptor subunit TctC